MLESLDHAQRYVSWIFSMCEPWLGNDVLEVGAGTGTFTQRFAEGRRITALEPFVTAADQLSERTVDDPRVTVVAAGIDEFASDEVFDSAVLVNVLEHLPDDVAALQRIRTLIAPEGRVVLFIPAHQWLMSDFDRAIGHYRRYSRRALRRAAADAGFEVSALRAVNFPGLFAWFIVARLAGMNPTESRFARIYDRFMIPVISRLEAIIHPPIGQSLFCVLRPDPRSN